MLNASNYHSWSEDVNVLFMAKGCYKFILDTEPPLSEKATDKDIRDCNLRIDRAYSTLYLSISKDYRKLISDIDDGKQAWIKLKTRFELQLEQELCWMSF
ncbi:hypothetical protein AVEN_249190-1 [Araneus ventricosus]|uniref:DUF4219 domain-containing protein n=1 Tax=Araneus ventricosus TaxID=182803 RepID=A0A4Y2HYL6_ARAVE|nr:hypothetical protein AVEN_249190-1 [Araneus ventricosus]